MKTACLFHEAEQCPAVRAGERGQRPLKGRPSQPHRPGLSCLSPLADGLPHRQHDNFEYEDISFLKLSVLQIAPRIKTLNITTWGFSKSRHPGRPVPRVGASSLGKK